MFPTSIFFRYLASSYMRSYVIVVSMAVLGLFVSCSFDVMHRLRAFNLSLSHFIQLATLKIPYLFTEIAFFLGFIATLYFFRKLKKHNEFTALLVSGVSVINIVAVIALLQFMTGLFVIGALGHIAPSLLGRMSKLEQRIAKSGNQGIQTLIAAKKIVVKEENAEGTKIYTTSFVSGQDNTLKNLSIVVIDSQHHLTNVYFAEAAYLRDSQLQLLNVEHQQIGRNIERKDTLLIPTILTINNFMEGLEEPENISFWRLKSKITSLANLGMPVARYQSYHAKLLIRPLTMMAWATLAVCFVLGYTNRTSQGQIKQTILPLLIGVVIYSVAENTSRLLVQMSMTPYYATFIPALILLLISILVILYLHEA